MISADIINKIERSDLEFYRFVDRNSENLSGLRDVYNNTLLHICASFKNADFVQYLLDKNITVTIINKFNEIAEDIATKNHDVKIMTIFEEHRTLLRTRQLRSQLDTTRQEKDRLTVANKRLREDNDTLQTENVTLDKNNKKLKHDITTYQEMLKKSKFIYPYLLLVMLSYLI